VYIDRKRYTLASGVGPKAERRAWEEFNKLQAAHEAASERHAPLMDPKSVPLVRELVSRFLEFGCATLKPNTVRAYGENLARFARDLGHLSCADIAPYHVTEWLAGVDTWSATTRRNVVVAIKRCFAWALDDGRLPTNPLARIKLTPAPPQITIPNKDEVAALMAEAAKTDAADILLFMHDTGCRVGEAMQLQASQLTADRSMAVVPNKTARATGKPRVIYIPESIRPMVAARAFVRPSGPIFITERGNPWTKATISNRVRSIRKRLGLGADAVPKMMRHDWITEALAEGVPVKAVAELAGHSSSAMIDKVYSHLGDRRDTLSEAAEKVRRAGAEKDARHGDCERSP
jgi:integrase/recombinase XerD